MRSAHRSLPDSRREGHPLGSSAESGPRNTWHDTRRFLRLLRPHLPKVLLASVIVVVSSLFKFTIPLAIMYILDKLADRQPIENFWPIFALLGGIVVAAYGLKLLMRYLLSVIQERVFLRVQMQLFRHLHRLPQHVLDGTDPGYLMARVRNDILAAQGLLADKIIQLAISVITFFAGLFFCFSLHTRMSLFALAILPFYTAAVILPNARLQRMGRNIQERSAEVFRALQEALSAVWLTRLFGREAWQARKLHHAISGEIRAKVSFAVFGASIGQLADLITNLGTLALLAYGTLAVVEQQLSLGRLMAFLSFYGFLVTSVGSVIALNVDYQQSVAAVGRIFSLLDLAAEEDGRSRAAILPLASLPPLTGVALRDVSFAYDKRNSALRQISLELRPGEVVALVGRSGAGKSTFAKLLPRLLEADQGTIEVNGFAIKDWSLAELRRAVGMVTHTPILLSGSVTENITLGRRSASRAGVAAASSLARAHDFIAALPLGYGTRLGSDGINLSVGQAQRIALARLVFHHPQVLIIDEGLSGVDATTESRILEDLIGEWRDGIVVLISHRLATVQRADRVVLLDEGRILRTGTHFELLEVSPLYRDLCQKQMIQEKGERVPRASFSEAERAVVSLWETR